MNGTDRVFIGTDEVHPAAQMFPEMDGENFANLKESIKANGIRLPVVFCDGKLLDGRNRLRAYLELGLPRARLPWTGIPPTVDPYRFAWDRNCERLDYTPDQKAMIKVKIEAASGDLARREAAAQEEANRLRAEKSREQIKAKPRRADGKIDKPGEAPIDASPGKPDKPLKKHSPKRSPRVATDMAREAGVSVSTMERALKKHRQEQEGKPAAPKPPPKPKPRVVSGHWEMPHQLGLMVARIHQTLNAEEFAEVVRLVVQAKELDESKVA